MKQNALNFNPTRPGFKQAPSNGTLTSDKASESIKYKTQSMREQILITLRYCRATREELAQQLGMKLQTVCGRVHELKKADYIRETQGHKAGSSGRSATVLEITEKGERHSWLAQTGQRG